LQSDLGLGVKKLIYKIDKSWYCLERYSRDPGPVPDALPPACCRHSCVLVCKPCHRQGFFEKWKIILGFHPWEKVGGTLTCKQIARNWGLWCWIWRTFFFVTLASWGWAPRNGHWRCVAPSPYPEEAICLQQPGLFMWNIPLTLPLPLMCRTLWNAVHCQNSICLEGRLVSWVKWRVVKVN